MRDEEGIVGFLLSEFHCRLTEREIEEGSEIEMEIVERERWVSYFQSFIAG